MDPTLLPQVPPDWSEAHIQQVYHICQVAATWWRSMLDKSASADKYNNGDDAGNGTGFGPLLAVMVATETPLPSTSQLDSFAHDLTDVLFELAAKRALSRVNKFCFGTEHNPDQLLAEVARRHYISSLHFPWKTVMWIDTEPQSLSVIVASGHGAPQTHLPI